jgi:hypothetical protein
MTGKQIGLFSCFFAKMVAPWRIVLYNLSVKIWAEAQKTGG